MNSSERERRIKEIRTRETEGAFVILVPASAEYAERIVNLRNRPRDKYWFNQPDVITTEGQIEWLEMYEERNDDIYWCVLNKERVFIGTIRLYGIDLNGDYCEEGSYAIDEDSLGEEPYAVEAKMLALDVAFRDLEIRVMINHNRVDHKVMNNIDNQLGFNSGVIEQIRGVDYLRRELKAEDYWNNRIKFASLIDYWSVR